MTQDTDTAGAAPQDGPGRRQPQEPADGTASADRSASAGEPEGVTAAEEPALDAIVALVPRLLTLLDALEAAGRRLHPPQLPGLVAPLAAPAEALRVALTTFESVDWPAPLHAFRTQASEA
ncbi:MAG: hypothetical protein J0H99_14730, partial [Rhodospirillales bacterium]|nr:hypothetical protein [Rhodospirillales bacterium]